MNTMNAVSSTVRFASFEVDLESRELRKQGMRMRLEEKPFLILEMLLQRPGGVVTRKALRERLWPDTHVRFDQNLNTAVNKLRDLLGDSAHSPRYIETLPRLGYRFICAPISPEKPAASANGKKMLAVLPFENLSGDPQQEYFADGLTEEMISHLGQLHPKRLGVIARTSAIQYKGTKKSIGEIAKELDVEYVIEGSIRCAEGHARITVQLIETRAQTHLWSANYERQLRQIFHVQANIAREVGTSLAVELLPADPSACLEFDPNAHEAYLRGRYFFGKRTEDGLRKAIASFESALAIEPRCARSYSGIADSYSMLCWYGAVSPAESGPKAVDAATRAIAIEPTLSEPHASLALARFWYEWDWAAAEQEFLRAIELNPSYASAHHWYAALLNAMGRFEEAHTAQRQARELDPHSLMHNMGGADSFFFSGNYGAAIQHLLSLLEQAPNYIPAHFNLGRVYLQTERFEQAVEHLEKAVELTGNHVALPVLGHAYALSGRTNKAKTVLQQVQSEVPGRYVPSPMIARLHLGLGELELALDFLEKGFHERSYWMVFLKADPVYDALRSHPRFVQLLERMAFPS
jgi:TolB-like protein/Flp pilus assembly protein TadD